MLNYFRLLAISESAALSALYAFIHAHRPMAELTGTALLDAPAYLFIVLNQLRDEPFLLGGDDVEQHSAASGDPTVVSGRLVRRWSSRECSSG